MLGVVREGRVWCDEEGREGVVWCGEGGTES